jgi:hypothetical protein
MIPRNEQVAARRCAAIALPAVVAAGWPITVPFLSPPDEAWAIIKASEVMVGK